MTPLGVSGGDQLVNIAVELTADNVGGVTPVGVSEGVVIKLDELRSPAPMLVKA